MEYTKPKNPWHERAMKAEAEIERLRAALSAAENRAERAERERDEARRRAKLVAEWDLDGSLAAQALELARMAYNLDLVREQRCHTDAAHDAWFEERDRLWDLVSGLGGKCIDDIPKASEREGRDE